MTSTILQLARLGDGPEIFHTLQGEGPSVGLPAVFVRTSRCNLHCVWCDTDHTWNFEGTPWPHEKDRQPGYRKHRKEEVTFPIHPAEACRLVAAYRCPRVVLTGGEPLLQEEALLELILLLRENRPQLAVEVETNGTRQPSPAFAAAVDQFNVSPKLANSGMPATLRIAPDVLRFFAESPRSWFKFVVARTADLDEIKALVADFGLPAARVLLMPEGRSAADLDRTAPWLAEHCRDHGFRFSDRLHIRLWGDRRGT